MYTREMVHEPLENLIGDYSSFFSDIYSELKEKGIDIGSYSLSHFGVRAETDAAYETLRDSIKHYCESYVENEHNGRLISKLYLQRALPLPHNFEVQLIELMPPKPSRTYAPGLEHLGVVIGETLREFTKEHERVISGRQDQGPFCKPYIIELKNDKRVKFYDLSLKEVVEKEGHVFKLIKTV